MNRLIRALRRPAPILAVLSVLLLLSSGCASSGSPASAPASQRDLSKYTSSGTSPNSQTSADQATPDRMIIRTASLSMEVADVDAVLVEISRLAADYGGFIVSADSSEFDGKRVGKASLRVESAKLDEAVGRIRGLARQVHRQSNTAKDVTEEYVDQDARLRNLQATESQYLQVLTTAKTIDEIMTVRKALSDVRDQIERTQARLQFLRQSTDLATISVDLETSGAAQNIRFGGWSFWETGRSAVQGLIDVALALASLAIWLVALSPVWVPALLLFRWWRKRRRAKKTTIPPAPAG